MQGEQAAPAPVTLTGRMTRLLASIRAGALFWGAVAAIVFAAYYIGLKQFHPTLWPGSYEYSQVARGIASGRGIVTGSGSVLEYWFLHSAGLPLAYFFHDIGNSLLMALFFKMLGAREQVIGLMSGTFLVLAAPLTFLFGSRLYGRKVAAVAAALVVVNAELLIYATTGHSEVPFAFFLTLFLFLLYRFRSGWGLLAAGLVFGWLIVLRSNTLPFLPWVLLFILFDPSDASGAAFGIREKWMDLRRTWRPRAAQLAVFLLGMLVLFAPNAVRNYVYMRSPLYNVNSVYSLVWYTSAISGKSQETFSQPGLNVDPLRFIVAHPGELANKMQYQLSRTADHLLTGVIYPDNWQDAFLILLFVVSLIAPLKGENQRQRSFRWLVTILILTALIVGSVFNIRWRHLYGFIPVAMIFIGSLLVRLLNGDTAGNRADSTRTLANSLGMVVLFALLIWGGIRPVLANANPIDSLGLDHRFQLTSEMVKANTPDSAIILTRAASGPIVELQNALAWYTGRQFLEYSDYTTEDVQRSKGNRPLYLLVAAADPTVAKQVAQAPNVPGFVAVATQKDSAGKIIAVLLRQE